MTAFILTLWQCYQLHPKLSIWTILMLVSVVFWMPILVYLKLAKRPTEHRILVIAMILAIFLVLMVLLLNLLIHIILM